MSKDTIQPDAKSSTIPAADEIKALANLALQMRELLLLVAPKFADGTAAARIVADANAAGNRLVEIANLPTPEN